MDSRVRGNDDVWAGELWKMDSGGRGNDDVCAGKSNALSRVIPAFAGMTDYSEVP